MRFFKKIKDFFTSNRKGGVKERSPVANETQNTNSPLKRIYPQGKATSELATSLSITEASICRTSYGFGKLKEDNRKRFLIFGEKIDVRYVPLVENGLIEAIYIIDPTNYVTDIKGRFVYEIVDSAQFFMLSKEQKIEIRSDLEMRGIPCNFPEEINNYNTVMGILRESFPIAKNQDSDWFEKEKFLSEIEEIKGSNTYKELQLIRLKDGRRFILIINQIIPNVIEYNPCFMNIYEPGAVKISYNDGYAFIAPFGRHT